MEIIGYFAAILIGLSLGLIGGGGSILTVPILIYFFHIDPILSTTYSLLVVGITSLAGSLSHFKNHNIDLKITALFGFSSFISVFLMRRFVMPAIPHHIATINSWELTKPTLLMLIFSVLMIVVAFSMIREKHDPAKQKGTINYVQLVFQGFVVGIITGFVGIGGGFLIIPSLVLFARMPMKKAVGSSLAIMAISALLGATGDILQKNSIDYSFLAIFSVFAIAGIIAGSILSRSINENKLKPAFGWLVLTIGILILISEIV